MGAQARSLWPQVSIVIHDHIFTMDILQNGQVFSCTHLATWENRDGSIILLASSSHRSCALPVQWHLI